MKLINPRDVAEKFFPDSEDDGVLLEYLRFVLGTLSNQGFKLFVWLREESIPSADLEQLTELDSGEYSWRRESATGCAKFFSPVTVPFFPGPCSILKLTPFGDGGPPSEWFINPRLVWSVTEGLGQGRFRTGRGISADEAWNAFMSDPEVS